MKYNLPDRAFQDICDFAKEHGVEKVILFGSRARGTHTERSDIDIAVQGGDFDAFYWDIKEKMWSLLMVDIVDLNGNISHKLEEAIKKDGIIIYSLHRCVKTCEQDLNGGDMNIHFRKMQNDDRDEVLAMMRIFYRSSALYTNGSEEVFINDFDNCVNDNPYLEGYIILLDQTVCGYSMIAKSFSTEFGKRCIWVEDLYLKGNSRGLGIGKKFFDYIEKQYRDMDVIFRLEVEKGNDSAIHLYREKGYSDLPYLEMKK